MRLIPKLHFGFTVFYSNGFVSSKIYDKRDDFDFDIVIFSFFWMVTFPMVNISKLIRFARVLSHVTDFNARNIFSAKLLQLGYRYINFEKLFKILSPTL